MILNIIYWKISYIEIKIDDEKKSVFKAFIRNTNTIKLYHHNHHHWWLCYQSLTVFIISYALHLPAFDVMLLLQKKKKEKKNGKKISMENWKMFVILFPDELDEFSLKKIRDGYHWKQHQWRHKFYSLNMNHFLSVCFYNQSVCLYARWKNVFHRDVEHKQTGLIVFLW